MKITKVLLAIRHTKKGGPSEFDPATKLPDDYVGKIGRDCIKAIELPYQITDERIDIFGSGTARTHQELTCLAMEIGLSGNTHDPLFGMGTDTMFADWMAAGLKQAALEAGSNISGLNRIFTESAFVNACEACAAEIRNAFGVMEYSYGLGVFHTPTIEMAGHALGMPFPDSLAEDTGLIFVQYEDGSVVCTGAWKSGDEIPEVE